MAYHLETRAILAGAYRGTSVSRRTLLTHVAVVREDGSIARVLCGRVDIDSLADSGAMDVHAIPTCQTCARNNYEQLRRDK